MEETLKTFGAKSIKLILKGCAIGCNALVVIFDFIAKQAKKGGN